MRMVQYQNSRIVRLAWTLRRPCNSMWKDATKSEDKDSSEIYQIPLDMSGDSCERACIHHPGLFLHDVNFKLGCQQPESTTCAWRWIHRVHMDYCIRSTYEQSRFASSIQQLGFARSFEFRKSKHPHTFTPSLSASFSAFSGFDIALGYTGGDG